MKSSRLVSILLLLQTRGRMTAAQLAEELEVSVRTVYRDVDALHAAGVPLYGDAGHAGGYQVLAGYRTKLTGLNTGEAEALFLSGIPGPAAELGLGSVLAAAQLKLRAELPAELRGHVDRMQSRFHLDAPGWYAEDTPVPFLQEVADAVWNGRVIDVRYRRWKEPTEVDRRLEPYGLVLKAGRWYVVAGPWPRTFRVDQILALTQRGEEFSVPAEFDLAAYWQQYQADFRARLQRGDAVVRLTRRAAEALSVAWEPAADSAADSDADSDADGRTTATVPIESVDHAHGEFLKLGAEIEVIAPAELRDRLAGTAARLAALYAS
ncbi:helix-turn-helix transcriptional regulator [Streptomyces beijiangensis]|uniref:YafY family transcriptional regulator n=1 Tax=Streptomyces beijiangensis TaxID=163361 RepID=A0A939F577_9ACTN|nr:YafY family protein [Streptomyces beijiangensis]MBO0511709.1 YafY family transcriptional regulator [Streptomyces beijiangensis]